MSGETTFLPFTPANFNASQRENDRLREALKKIRDQDFRGNRCPCSDLARRALEAEGGAF